MAGVKVFFVISGFIMALTTATPTFPGQFLLHRFVRIAPLYWLLTTLAVMMIAQGFMLFGHSKTRWREVITSLLFLPDVR